MADMREREIQFLRQFISPLIDGDNTQAILGALGDEHKRQEDLQIAVTDNLSICTSGDIYLDKLLASKGIIRPAELGMEDQAYRELGIKIDANKQITEVVHDVLSTFYGDEAVRAYAQSGSGEPYALAPGHELRFSLEDGIEQVVTFATTDFRDITQATAREVADVITRFLRNSGYLGYALPFLDVETGATYVRLFGSALGPYSLVTVLGGQAQTIMKFPTVRGTELSSNDTVWEITRTIGSTLRFRWTGSGSAPALDKIFIGDRVLIYGPQFAAEDLQGTYEVTNVRPPQPVASYDSGWFEFEKIDFTELRSSTPDVMPPVNQPATPWSGLTTYPVGYIVSYNGGFYESLQAGNLGNQPDISASFWAATSKNGVFYTITLSQVEYEDLMFFLGKKNVPYGQPRFALAWEPADSLLKIYLPATTKVVKRDLIGGAHVHALYPAGNLDGAFGSSTDPDLKVQVLGDYALRYRQNGFDNLGFGGTLSWGLGPTEVPIEYAVREGGYTTVVTQEPHGVPSTTDPYGRMISDEVVTVQVDRYNVDDPANPFLGPYVIDPQALYALGPTTASTRERVLAGESRNTLFVNGLMPNSFGILWFDLNRDTEEGPVRYYGAQVASAPTVVDIVSISQNGTTVTVITSEPHGAIPGSQVMITGTVNFNSTWTVDSVPSPTTYLFTKTPSAILAESGVGQSATLVGNSASTLIMDPSYNFRHNHEVGSDVTLLEGDRAYQPLANGLDYGFYVTGTADGRVFVQQLVNAITAVGIKLEVVVVYPNDVGLGNMGLPKDENESPHSEAVEVWGT